MNWLSSRRNKLLEGCWNTFSNKKTEVAWTRAKRNGYLHPPHSPSLLHVSLWMSASFSHTWFLHRSTIREGHLNLVLIFEITKMVSGLTWDIYQLPEWLIWPVGRGWNALYGRLNSTKFLKWALGAIHLWKGYTAYRFLLHIVTI